MVCQAVNYDKCCTTSSPVCSSPVIEAAVWGAVWRAGQGLANYYSGRQMLLSSSRIIASRPQLNFIPNYQSCYETRPQLYSSIWPQWTVIIDIMNVFYPPQLLGIPNSLLGQQRQQQVWTVETGDIE